MATSVSSHLSPEPERRLFIILEQVTQAAQWADLKIGALTAFAAAELAAIHFLGQAHPVISFPLAATLPLGVLGFSPLTGKPGRLTLLEPSEGKQGPDDNLTAVDDLVKYSHGELIGRLDRYLGGGIAATPYHEGIVERIAVVSRMAARKERVLFLLCVLVGVAQMALLGLLIRRI